MEKYVWSERYRPATIADCILPAGTKTTCEAMVATGKLQNLLLAGPQGIGKTTVAKAMVDAVNGDVLFINGSQDRGIDVLREQIARFAGSVSMLGGRKYVILDEADYLVRDSTQVALRGFIEEYIENCSFLLTANFPNRIIQPLHSRCALIPFNIPSDERRQLMNATLKRLELILKTENVTADRELLIAVVKKWFPDIRRMINELQRHTVSGVVLPSILAQSNADFDALAQALKVKNFQAMRDWIGTRTDISEASTFYTSLFDYLEPKMHPDSLGQAVLILADYQFKHGQVPDPILNLTACCTELMGLTPGFKA